MNWPHLTFSLLVTLYRMFFATFFVTINKTIHGKLQMFSTALKNLLFQRQNNYYFCKYIVKHAFPIGSDPDHFHAMIFVPV